MKYILGLVGHPEINQQVTMIIQNHFDKIAIHDIPISNDKDIEAMGRNIDAIKKKCSGVLFTGKDIHHLFYSRIKLKINSAYLDDNMAEILKALFKVNHSDYADIKNISIDSISYPKIVEIYNELGLNSEGDNQIITIPVDISHQNIVEEITQAHLKNHAQFSSTCITFFTETKNKLANQNIPVFQVGVNQYEVIQKVNRLVTIKHADLTDSSQRVAIIIRLSDLKEHHILDNSEHNIVSEYNRISEAVYWFCQKLDGAYIPNDQRKYIIFCSRQRYESETDFSSNLDILNEVAKKNYFYCNVGVGYGDSEQIAIKNATIAQIKSSKEKRCSAYIMYDQAKTIGPLLPLSHQVSKNNTFYDVKLNEIASKSSVSINTIFKLHDIISKSGDTDFTSKDISNHLGITIRSANRLIAKLITSSSVKPIGDKSTGGKGRPIRIYRFLF